MEMLENRRSVCTLPNIVHLAYAKACSSYDFKMVTGSSACCLPLTGWAISSSVYMQGLGSVTVRDAAGGPPGAEFGSESSDSDDAKDEDLKDKRTKLNCWSQKTKKSTTQQPLMRTR